MRFNNEAEAETPYPSLSTFTYMQRLGESHRCRISWSVEDSFRSGTVCQYLFVTLVVRALFNIEDYEPLCRWLSRNGLAAG